MRFMYLILSVILWPMAELRADSRAVALPPMASVDQLVSRYLRYQSGGYSQVIVPTRMILNKSDLAFLVCSSRSGVVPDIHLVTATSEPEKTIATRLKEQSGGPTLTPFCYRSLTHNFTYSESSSLRVNLTAVGDYVPFRSIFVDLIYFNSSDRVPLHVQFATTKDSSIFGFVHLWSYEVLPNHPVPVFACLASAGTYTSAELASSDGLNRKSINLKSMNYGCYDLGEQTFSGKGTWILKLGGSETHESVFEIQIGGDT